MKVKLLLFSLVFFIFSCSNEGGINLNISNDLSQEKAERFVSKLLHEIDKERAFGSGLWQIKNVTPIFQKKMIEFQNDSYSLEVTLSYQAKNQYQNWHRKTDNSTTQFVFSKNRNNSYFLESIKYGAMAKTSSFVHELNAKSKGKEVQ